jgi:predicted nucleotidyltransferase
MGLDLPREFQPLLPEIARQLATLASRITTSEQLQIPILGITIPNMGANIQSAVTDTSLASALFSTTQQRVFGLLFGQPDRSFYANEIITLSGAGSGATQRELARLEAAGLVTTSRVGNQKHFQANATSPIFDELVGIMAKTVGVTMPLAEALQPFTRKIRAAFVYGSVAKKSDTAMSDIDLMVIADKLEYADLFETLATAEARLGRPVNPTVQPHAEWKKKLAANNAFTVKVNAQPKLFVIGDEAALA